MAKHISHDPKERRIRRRPIDHTGRCDDCDCLSCHDTGMHRQCNGQGCIDCGYTGLCPFCQDIPVTIKR